MSVQVKLARSASGSFTAWTRRLAPSPDDSLRLADVYFESMQAELIHSKGRPHRAYQILGLEPELWIWEFQSRLTWIIYAVRRKGSWLARLFGTDSVEITILAVQDRGPTKEEIEILTRALRLRL